MVTLRRSTRQGWIGLLRRLAFVALMVLPWLASEIAQAAPMDLHGTWSEAGSGRRVDQLSPTGGRYVFQAQFQLQHGGDFVLDFKNSSVLAHFRHAVYDDRGLLVAGLSGGLSSDEANPFFMRHGRELSLPAGHYRLVTELDSPFYLAQPEPYLDTQANYRQAIKPGNVLVLLCLGVFIGLGAYYACLSLVRRRLAEGLYVLFILGNLLYNSSALLVVREIFGAGWFYLISVPILFSNIAYVLFVMVLLGIRADVAPRLHLAGRVLVALFIGFVAVAALRPHWSLELDRAGVGLFLVYGLSAGIMRSLQGNKLARWYLVANIGFFISGVTAISLAHLQGVYAIYIEHIGLVAVTIEVLLLALVLAYQFGLLQQEKDQALARAEQSLQLACTDALTGLANRYALDLELAALPAHGSLTFIDLDGLKFVNDRFGHARGDELLCAFAQDLAKRLDGVATLHRLGGDEFAATSRSGACDTVEAMLGQTIAALRQAGYELVGASRGSVKVHECSDREQLKHLSDTRMYEHKRRRVRDGLQAAERQA